MHPYKKGIPVIAESISKLLFGSYNEETLCTLRQVVEIYILTISVNWRKLNLCLPSEES
jgi:hypothetical protein